MDDSTNKFTTVADDDDDDDAANQKERLLPITNVVRIMRHILPPEANISKEAKQTMQECASEFLSFVTSEAAEKCKQDGRKKLNSDDGFWAMATVGFGDYVEFLKSYIERYREEVKQSVSTPQKNEDEDEDEGEPSSSAADRG